MTANPPAVSALSTRLPELDWVSDLWVAGSLATVDYVPGVSDLDLVAVVDGPLDPARRATLVGVHRDLDRGEAAGCDLGCVYVEQSRLELPAAVHLTWTHGQLVDRILSGITRAELVRHGFAVLGRAPAQVINQLRARRRGEDVASPRNRSAWIAWRGTEDGARSAPSSHFQGLAQEGACGKTPVLAENRGRVRPTSPPRRQGRPGADRR